MEVLKNGGPRPMLRLAVPRDAPAHHKNNKIRFEEVIEHG